jgi:hypothetical protein
MLESRNWEKARIKIVVIFKLDSLCDFFQTKLSFCIQGVDSDGGENEREMSETVLSMVQWLERVN